MKKIKKLINRVRTSKPALVVSALLLAVSGCASSGLNVPMSRMDSMNPPASAANEVREKTNAVNLPYRIQAGDKLGVRFFFNPDLNQDITVQPDGAVSLPILGTRQVRGLTIPEMSQLLRETYSSELRQPEVIVQLVEAAPSHIYVGGEVRSPQEVTYRRGLTPLEVVLSAGGFKSSAAANKIVIVRKDGSGSAGAGIVDLRRMVAEGRTVELQPWDVVLVPRDGISRVNEWVDKYVKNLLLFNGITISYDLNDALDDE